MDRLQTGRQAALDIGHHSDPGAPADLLETLEGVAQRVFGLRVDRNNERLKAGVERLLDLGQRRLGPHQLALEDDLVVRRQFAGVEDGRGLARTWDAREEDDSVGPCNLRPRERAAELLG